MACHLSSVKAPPPWISSLSIRRLSILLFLALSWYLGYGFFSTILSSMAVILSTLSIFTQSNQKQNVSEKVTAKKETSQEEEEGRANENPASESEDSESDWTMEHRVFTSSNYSDGSISDEESLIEIMILSGQYVGNKKHQIVIIDDQVKEPSFCAEKERSEFDMAAFFKQHGLMELLTEVNEEENLIEIDLSMGSIKCPTKFEIEA